MSLVLAKTEETLASVGLTSKMASFPRQLSGGEQQRVAIARAIVAEPSAVLADEPTAALDAANGQATMMILSAIAKKRGRAVLVVTYDPRLFGFADRIVHIEDGSLMRQELTDLRLFRDCSAASITSDEMRCSHTIPNQVVSPRALSVVPRAAV